MVNIKNGTRGCVKDNPVVAEFCALSVIAGRQLKGQ
jgi:hypothetical protein